MHPVHLAVGVLMGGMSPKREMSLRSGAAVADALESLGHKVLRIDVRTDTGLEFADVPIDVAFIALHERFGEDGVLQKILDRRGIPYTGSGPAAAHAAMDKVASKRIFRLRNVDIPPHRIITREDRPKVLEQYARSLAYPVTLKPQAEVFGLSVTVHEDFSTLLEGAIECFRYGRLAVMEKLVQGRALAVGILDGQPLSIVEKKPSGTMAALRGRYESPRAQYETDPALEEPDSIRVRKAAREAYAALGCEGAAGVDIILAPSSSVYVTEVNTAPGLAERNLIPTAARAAGIAFPQLCRSILEGAFRRHTYWSPRTAAV